MYEKFDVNEEGRDNEKCLHLKLKNSFQAWKKVAVLLCFVAAFILLLQIVTLAVIFKVRSDQELVFGSHMITECGKVKNCLLNVSENTLQKELHRVQNENLELKTNLSTSQSNEQILQEELRNLESEKWKLQQNLSTLLNDCQQVNDANRSTMSTDTSTSLRSNSNCAYSALQSQDYETVVNPRVPFNHTIRENGIGKRVFIGGTVDLTEARVGFNFLRGNGDIAFHLDFRENQFGDVKRIVANNKVNGVWGKEERTDYWPIVQHRSFCIEFTRMANAFQVKFNGKHLLNFLYRPGNGNIDDYVYLHIRGDIILSEVSFTVT